MDKIELLTRLKKFALRVVLLCDALPKVKLSGIIEYQLLNHRFQLQRTIAPVAMHSQKQLLFQN